MFNLFDILQAQAGANAQSLGHQFGLTPEQSRRAMEALLPAVTMGLQRNAASDPTGFAQMFNLVAPRGAAAVAQTPQMDLLVRQLFGSHTLSQAVVQQAAAVSGVAMPALKQMLPVMAGMVVAGIVHVMMNQAPAPAPPPQASPSPFGFTPNTYWMDLMQSFMTGGGLLPAGPRASQSAPASRGSSTPPRLAAPPKTPTLPDNPFQAFQQLFQTGLEVQQEHAKAMQGLFDNFWGDRASATAAEPTTGTRPPSGRPKR